jgi:hypothetical protein
MKKENINVLKLIPFFVPLNDKTLTVYGKIYSLNNSLYWDANYYYKPNPDADYNIPTKLCSSIEEGVEALNAYMKGFTQDYMYNRQF